MSHSKFSYTFDKALVEKLSEHFDQLQKDEPSAWQRIALDLKGVDGVELQRWQTLSLYFKQSLVFKLKKFRFINDEELIDRLQYPYLRKVYSVTIRFFTKEPAKVINLKDSIEDNALLIKYMVDGKYDPAVVAAYKRRGGKGTRIYVNINVNDPRYRLSADQRELLMQIEHSRKRKANKRGCQIEAGTWYETAGSSPGVTIENVASPVAQGSNGSVRGLLDEESLEINTQQYDQMIKDSLDPEIPSPPKMRCFTVDSNVDSEEDDVLEVSSEDETSAEGDGKHDSGSEPKFIFIDPSDILKANASVNVSRDPLQQSVLQQVDSSQVADGERDSTTSEPMFTPSSGESAKTTADQTGLEHPQESVSGSTQPPSSEPDTVRSSCGGASANIESIPTVGADRTSIVEDHHKVPERSSSVADGSAPRREDLAAKSQPPTLILQEEALKTNLKTERALTGDSSDSKSSDESAGTTAGQTVDPDKTAPEQPQESVGESQPSPPNEPTTVRTSCDAERVEQSSVDVAPAKTESISNEETDRTSIVVDHHKAPEGSSSVEVGSALRRETLVAKSQPKTVNIRSTVVKENPSESIPEKVADFAADSDEPHASTSLTQVTVVNAGRPVGHPATASSPVEVAVAVSEDINASTVDLVSSGRMAQSTSSADAVHMTHSSVEPATSSPKIVQKNAFEDPPVPAKVLEPSSGVENGSTSRPTVVKVELSDGFQIPESLIALLISDSDESAGTIADQTAESEITAPEHPQESVVASQLPPLNESETVQSSCCVERVEQISVEIAPIRADRTSIVEDHHKVPERSSIVENGSTSQSTVLKEEPSDGSGFWIFPPNMKNTAALIAADSEDEDESPTLLDLANLGSKARPASSSDAAHVARPSVESNSALEMVADSGIEDTGRPGGDDPVALQCGSGREESSDAVIQDPAETTQDNTVTTSEEATLPNASSACNNSLQSSNSDHESLQTTDKKSAAVFEDQIVPRGASIEVPPVPSVNIQPIQPHRWAAHHRILEPVIRSHATLYGTLRQRWPQLFQRPTPTRVVDLNSVNNVIANITNVIGATLFNGLNLTDNERALELRTAVDALAIRIAYGLTQQERSINPRRSPLAERNWEVVVRSSEDGVPMPKRIKISESASSSSYSLQSNSSVRICLSDSEDSPSLLLPARKKRGYRVRQN